MDEGEVYVWLTARIINLGTSLSLAHESKVRIKSVEDIADRLHSLATEAELRLSNPNFPEVNEK